MKHTGKCPKCAGTDILGDVLALDRGDSNSWHELCVGRDRKPEALIFKGRETTTVSAWVCVACGYTELYADRPTDIRVGPDPEPPKAREPFRNPFDPA